MEGDVMARGGVKSVGWIYLLCQINDRVISCTFDLLDDPQYLLPIRDYNLIMYFGKAGT